jgi:ferredoxin
LCKECELCVDACPQNALISYVIVEEAPALAPRSLMGAQDTAEIHHPSKQQITGPATIQIDTPKRSLGDWLGAAFNFLVFDLEPIIEGIIDTSQTQKGRQERSIRHDERSRGGRRGRGRNGQKIRRRRHGRW